MKNVDRCLSSTEEHHWDVGDLVKRIPNKVHISTFTQMRFCRLCRAFEANAGLDQWVRLGGGRKSSPVLM